MNWMRNNWDKMLFNDETTTKDQITSWKRVFWASNHSRLISALFNAYNIILRRNVVFQASVQNLLILSPIREEQPSVFASKETIQIPPPCSLVQYFQREGKLYDKDCKLTSFERKRRSHQVFGAGHRANEQLLCPEQACQIELHFVNLSPSDVIVRLTFNDFSGMLLFHIDYETKLRLAEKLWLGILN
uniref:Uncharacterized protein n=1 Tax=Heterorhabditis bacteriophora TaxID=37862 RepID=A0A1I7WUR7_HETBA